MKKVLVSLAFVTALAACGDSSTSTTSSTSDSLKNAATVDSLKMKSATPDTSMHKPDSTMNKMADSTHNK